MIRTSIVGAVLALAFSTAANAECITAPQVVENIQKSVKDATVAEPPEGFMAAFNALPPVTNIQADHVLIFTHKSKSMALVTMFNGGCWVASQQIPLNALRQMLAKLEGNAI